MLLHHIPVSISRELSPVLSLDLLVLLLPRVPNLPTDLSFLRLSLQFLPALLSHRILHPMWLPLPICRYRQMVPVLLLLRNQLVALMSLCSLSFFLKNVLFSAPLMRRALPSLRFSFFASQPTDVNRTLTKG